MFWTDLQTQRNENIFLPFVPIVSVVSDIEFEVPVHNLRNSESKCCVQTPSGLDQLRLTFVRRAVLNTPLVSAQGSNTTVVSLKLARKSREALRKL